MNKILINYIRIILILDFIVLLCTIYLYYILIKIFSYKKVNLYLFVFNLTNKHIMYYIALL